MRWITVKYSYVLVETPRPGIHGLKSGKFALRGAMMSVYCPNCLTTTVDAEQYLNGIGSSAVRVSLCKKCGFNEGPYVEGAQYWINVWSSDGQVLFTHAVNAREKKMTQQEFLQAVIMPREQFWTYNVTISNNHMGRTMEHSGADLTVVRTERKTGSFGGPCLFCGREIAVCRIDGDSSNGYQCQQCSQTYIPGEDLGRKRPRLQT